MQLNFMAIDFETANDRYDSACAIGIAFVADGEVAETFYSLINPGCAISPENTAIHGITDVDVKDAPTLEDIWPDIVSFLGRCVVLAHNAIFDMSVLKKSLPEYMTEGIDFKYVDTISLCRDFVPGQKNLAHCAECLGVPLEHHHNALDDAVACAKIALECMARTGLSIGDLCFALPNVKVHHFSDLRPGDSYKQSRNGYGERKERYIKPSPRVSDIKCTVECIDPNSLLCGKAIVFTGELSIDRKEAMQLAVNAGAIVRTGVSKKTDYLVVGAQDTQLVGEDGMSGKEEKARELNSSGTANIKIIDEKQFLSLVKGTCCVEVLT